jgi:hypothetical protein
MHSDNNKYWLDKPQFGGDSEAVMLTGVATVSKFEAVNIMNKQCKEIESLKAQLVDATGDGFYDGYLACNEHAKAFSFDSYDANDSYILKLSEQYESEHKYAKSIAEIKASALDDLYNELAEIPYVGVNAAFLKQRANAIREAAKGS